MARGHLFGVGERRLFVSNTSQAIEMPEVGLPIYVWGGNSFGRFKFSIHTVQWKCKNCLYYTAKII